MGKIECPTPLKQKHTKVEAYAHLHSQRACVRLRLRAAIEAVGAGIEEDSKRRRSATSQWNSKWNSQWNSKWNSKKVLGLGVHTCPGCSLRRYWIWPMPSSKKRYEHPGRRLRQAYH